MSVRVFLSTVTDEFRDYRDQLRGDLTRHNVEVKVQEDFKDTGGVTLEKLNLYIANCDVVVHLVGDMTGAAAKPASTRAILAIYPDLPEKLPSLGEALERGEEVSYTQWEAWLALYHDKALLIAQVADGAPRGPRYACLDTSRAAQLAHLARLRAMERYPGSIFSSPDQLAKQIFSTNILDLLVEKRLAEERRAAQSTAAVKVSAVQDEHGTLLNRILKAVDKPEQVDDKRIEYPPMLESLIKEGERLVGEGHYGRARESYALATQIAQEQNCIAGIEDVDIRIAETHILEQRNILQSQQILRSYLCAGRRPKVRQKVLGLLADSEILLGHVDEARSLYREAQQISRNMADRCSEGLHLMGLAHAEELLGNLSVAHRNIDEAVELLRAEHRDAKGDDARATAVNLGSALASKAVLFRHEGKLTDAVACLARAEPVYREANSRDNLGRTLLLKGELLLNEAKQEEGFAAIHEALSLFESLSNAVWQCRCLDRLARFYFDADNQATAIACLSHEVQVALAARMELQIIPALIKLAHLLRDSNHTDEAKSIVGEARQIADNLSADAWRMAQILIAETQCLQGSDAENTRKDLLRKALRHMEAALASCEIKGARAEHMQRIGDIHRWLGEPREARQWFELALQEHQQIGDVSGICGALAGLAAAAREQGAPVEAMGILERLLKVSEGRHLHLHRASALHDLGMLQLSQGNVELSKKYLEECRALAEKHNFRDVLDPLNNSMDRLSDAEQFHSPPQRDLPELLRELHDWRSLHPQMEGAIIPLWYFLHRAELWGIVRSKLGVKFIVCSKTSTLFKRTADILKLHGDLFVWGTNFAFKTKPKVDMVPMPEHFWIPRHLKLAMFNKTPRDPEGTRRALFAALRDEQYILVPFDAAVGALRGTQFWVFGRHLRIPTSISKMMLQTPVKELLDKRWICLPLGEGHANPTIAHVMRVSWRNGAIPVFIDRLPEGDEVKSVCDLSVRLPNDSQVIRKYWLRLLVSCGEAPGKSLSVFADQVAEHPEPGQLSARIYMLRFQAGERNVVHPAVVMSGPRTVTPQE